MITTSTADGADEIDERQWDPYSIRVIRVIRVIRGLPPESSREAASFPYSFSVRVGWRDSRAGVKNKNGARLSSAVFLSNKPTRN